jgi:nitrogen PTS system EIIA component
MQLTMRDAARLLGVPEANVERWIRNRELNATRVADRWRLNRIDVLEFAAARNLAISSDLLSELEAQAPAPPSLAEAVRAGGVHHGVAGSDKASILAAVVDRLRLPDPGDRELLLRVLLAREALGSTGLGNGIAIPHPRNPIVLHVQRPEAAICYLDQPVEFEAIDGKPVHTLITLVSPSTRAHLHMLAIVAAALHDPKVLSLLGARAGADALVPEIARVEAAMAARRGGAGAA